ncbi:MAG: hypothetical protein QQN41_03815 [Nitrosopumilus sp.]
MLLDDFKKTVDLYSANIPSDNLLQACQQLGIDTTRGYSGHQVTQELYKNIKEALAFDSKATTNRISRTQLLKLQSELVYRHVLCNEDPVEYLITLKVLKDSCRHGVNYFPPFSKTNKWKKAIINCKNYNKFSPSTHSIIFGSIRDDYPKDFDIASSVKQLMEKGCKIEIKNSDIQITSGLEGVVNELDAKVKEIGGITLAKSLFNHLKQKGKYSTRFERYFITRVASGISFDQRPQIPFGYLLNLALKYPVENLKLKNPQKLLDEIIELSITITNGAYGVQHYNYWEYYFQSGETIIQFCTEISLWDSMFSLPQCRPSTALEITDNLFSFIKETVFQNFIGFSRKQLITVSKEIQSISSNLNEPTIIYHSVICKKIKLIDKDVIQKILNFLSHSNTVNEGYLLPSDYSSIDFFRKPLIKLGNTKFLLMDNSWSSPNYFEAVVSNLRNSIPDLDSKIGIQLEVFLQDKLTEKGITFSSGEYRIDGINGECDLLIESDKAVILIEFKKKVLTRKSKSGIDINILLDLSDSILSAQLQAGRTEIFLREKGSIKLRTRDGKAIVVNLNDRQIERVALTQLEFGGFQDRTIINQFLKSLITHSFRTYSKDQKIINKFEKLAEMQKVWVKQYNKLYHLDEGFSQFPYFNCWFLSLPQLLEVISISIDNNSFYETFRKTKHVSMNTLDWYREFDIATKMREVK